MVILALAVGISYIPVAKAGENASFGLTVNFAQDLKIWSEPEGPFVIELGEELVFRVEAEDLDANILDLNALELPEGAEWIPDPIPIGGADGDRQIIERSGTFRWTPEDGRYFKAPTDVYFTAISYGKDSQDIEHVELVVSITVTPHMLTLSIIVEPDMLTLGGVKLGEIVPVADTAGGSPIVRNVGNTPAGVEISYGATIQVEGQVRPGLVQGLDTFITLLGKSDTLLEPGKWSRVSLGINPDEAATLKMQYGAPTELSGNGETAGALYELRAFPAVKLIPMPMEDPETKADEIVG